MPEIETARLRLRMFTMDDFDDFHRVSSDPDVVRYIGAGKPVSKEEIRPGFVRLVENFHKRGFGRWALVHKEHGELIGYSGLTLLDGTSEVELVYLLARAYWGMGLATEAAKACLRYGFEKLRLERIVAITMPENAASRRVLERVGMKYEKEARYYNVDTVRYAISRGDYQPDDSPYVLSE